MRQWTGAAVPVSETNRAPIPLADASSSGAGSSRFLPNDHIIERDRDARGFASGPLAPADIARLLF